MPTLSESRALRLVTFAALYFAQGLPWGFVSVGYVVLLADLGYDNTAIGAAVGLSYLPWSFKVAWGPLLDAVPPLRIGRRRPFIVGAQLALGGTLLALMFIDPRASLPTVTLVLFLNNTFASLQDVAVDALAVDTLTDDERGRANSLMWAGKSLGVVAGGGGGTLFAKHLGYPALFVTMACVVWAIMLLPLLIRERPPHPDDRPVDPRLVRLLWFLLPVAAVGGIMYGLSEVQDHYAKEPWIVAIPIVQPFAAVLVAIAAWPLVDRAGFAALRKSFSFATPWWGVVVGVLTPCGYALIPTVMTRLIRVDLGLSEEKIATLSGVVDPASGVVGALIGGVLADKVGKRSAMALAMVGIAVCLFTWAVTRQLWADWWFLIGYSIAFNLCIYAYNASSLGLYMSLSNPQISATHFAIFMATTNLTYAWATPLAGVIADRWGAIPLFVTAGILQLATIVTLLGVDPRRAAAVYGR